jgi:hypothetical protein
MPNQAHKTKKAIALQENALLKMKFFLFAAFSLATVVAGPTKGGKAGGVLATKTASSSGHNVTAPIVVPFPKSHDDPTIITSTLKSPSPSPPKKGHRAMPTSSVPSAIPSDIPSNTPMPSGSHFPSATPSETPSCGGGKGGKKSKRAKNDKVDSKGGKKGGKKTGCNEIEEAKDDELFLITSELGASSAS